MTAAVLALLPAPPGFARRAAASQVSLRNKTTKPKLDPPAKPLAMPFRAGETLKYRVAWAAFSSAASVELAVPEQRDLFGYATWHFRALARTLSPVRPLFTIDDQFDSYTDASTLESRQYETHLDEMGNIQDQVFHFLPSGEASRAPGPSVVVLPGTRDPLGMLYALRRVDWDRTPEFRGPVYDGHDIYEVRAQREAAGENVKVAAGSFSASRVSVAVFQHEKEMAAVHFTVWFANDASRAPVVMQAQLPFGGLRAELISASQ
ncbi:MAG: DUF3108 domain-containing protein [Candidatus Acidiferrales bacterium]